jgi:hypothetical protein
MEEIKFHKVDKDKVGNIKGGGLGVQKLGIFNQILLGNGFKGMYPNKNIVKTCHCSEVQGGLGLLNIYLQ